MMIEQVKFPVSGDADHHQQIFAPIRILEKNHWDKERTRLGNSY